MPRRSSRPGRPQARDAGSPGDALDAGLRLLGRRAHSRAELLLKLTRRGYEGAAVRYALRRLHELGYLDDQSFARSYVRRRASIRGPRALAAELAARGVDRAEAEGAGAEFGEAEQLAAAMRIAERLYSRKPLPSYRETLNAIGSKLLRRGFSPATARAACMTVLERRSEPAEAQAPPPTV